MHSITLLIVSVYYFIIMYNYIYIFIYDLSPFVSIGLVLVV